MLKFSQFYSVFVSRQRVGVFGRVSVTFQFPSGWNKVWISTLLGSVDTIHRRRRCRPALGRAGWARAAASIYGPNSSGNSSAFVVEQTRSARASSGAAAGAVTVTAAAAVEQQAQPVERYRMQVVAKDAVQAYGCLWQRRMRSGRTRTHGCRACAGGR